MEINLTINGQHFLADIEDTETGRAFARLLPLKATMTELNGNEKYINLNTSLPTNAHHYDTIASGDLMLFGSSCIVLFYGSAGGYSYTSIGRLRTTEGLTAAAGRGNAEVTFDLKAK